MASNGTGRDRTWRRRQVFGAFALLVGAVFLAGGDCPGGNGGVTPTPSPTASPTPTPGPGDPTNNPPVPAAAAAPAPQLFIANLGGSVTSYIDPASINGNIAPDTNLEGGQTQLNRPGDVAVSFGGDLLVSNLNGSSVTTYADACKATGNMPPAGNVQGDATLLNNPSSIALLERADLLFVANVAANDVLVFEGTSPDSFNGNQAPVRTIFGGPINAPAGLRFGGNGDLYVANSGAANVLVFANAASLNGPANPARTITSADLLDVFDVFVTADDVLVVLDNRGMVFSFENASALNGNVSPDSQLTIGGAANVTGIAIDESGTGYIADAERSAIYVYDNIVGRNGVVDPDRVIEGGDTLLREPYRLFISPRNKTIPRGVDCWVTTCGLTRVNFCEEPIPADFFGDGSDPFAGEVILGGPGGVDTQVERMADMDLTSVGSEAVTPLQIIALELQSCEPITVTINGQPTEWDVQVLLSQTQPPAGMMTVTKTHPNGGVFHSEFFVQPFFTFTRVDDSSQVVTLDSGAAGRDPDFLTLPLASPWVHRLTDGALGPCGMNFAPNVDENPTTGEQCCREICHPGATATHCNVVGHDCSDCPDGACCFDEGGAFGACRLKQSTMSQSAEDICASSNGFYMGDTTTCVDADSDGIPDVYESDECFCDDFAGGSCDTGTDPSKPDTDEDGCLDGQELEDGTDPCDECSFSESCASATAGDGCP